MDLFTSTTNGEIEYGDDSTKYYHNADAYDLV